MKRQELNEYRTNNTKTFLNRDGTIDIEIYDKNLNNQNSSGISPITTITGSDSSSSIIDTYIYGGDSNATPYDEDILKVGVERSNNQDTIYRSLLKFELPTIPASYTMVKARLNLIGYADTSYDEYNPNTLISVHQITEDWTESSAKWNNMNDKYNSKIENYFYATRSSATIEDNTITINPKTAYVDITGLVTKWYEPNYGLMLKAYDETYNANVRSGQFYSQDNTFTENNPKPRIIITYKNFNGLENILLIHWIGFMSSF